MAKINKTYKPGDEFTPDSVNEIIAAINKNVDDISNTQVYSTVETVIGMFNNKPLYRKVITVYDTFEDGVSKKIPHNIANFDRYINFDVIDNYGQYTFPYITPNSSFGLSKITQTDLEFTAYGERWENISLSVVLEYLKK